METVIRFIGYALAVISGLWISHLAYEHGDYKIAIAAISMGLGGLILGILGADDDR